MTKGILATVESSEFFGRRAPVANAPAARALEGRGFMAKKRLLKVRGSLATRGGDRRPANEFMGIASHNTLNLTKVTGTQNACNEAILVGWLVGWCYKT